MLNLLIFGNDALSASDHLGTDTLVSSSASPKASGCMSLDTEQSSDIWLAVCLMFKKMICGLCVLRVVFRPVL